MSSLPTLQQRIAPSRFGRRQAFTYAMPMPRDGIQSLAGDVRLFATTFLGGLLFMTVYLA